MLEKVRRSAAVVSLLATLVAAVLVLVKGVTPVPGLAFLTLFLISIAARPEPRSTERDDATSGPSRR